MKTLIKSAIAAAALGTFGAGWTLAQDVKFAAADTNGSGMVSLSEFQAALPDATAERFAAADADGDGALTRDEFSALTSG